MVYIVSAWRTGTMLVGVDRVFVEGVEVDMVVSKVSENSD